MGGLPKVSLDLDGRVAVVTGGSQGLGQSMAAALAAHGAQVVISARSRDKVEETAAAIRAAGGKAVGIPLDIADAVAVEATMAEINDRFGRFDILINNAGQMNRTPVKEVLETEWDQVVDTNLKGSFLCTKAAGKHMINRAWGRVINITSLWGEHVWPNRAVYSMTKAGLSQFTRVLAREWGPYGITINSVGPGVMITEMSRPSLSKSEVSRGLLEHISVGRFGQPDDLNGLILLLCSEAGGYISGQTVLVDGGYF